MVTRDVEPYSIVAGNPARFIKYRFSEDIRKKLLNFDFENLSKEIILKNKNILYEDLHSNNVDSILKKLV